MHSKNLEAYFAARSSRSASSMDQVARALREADMMPSGGRGRHAPQLGPDDIARFVIAAAVSKYPTDAGELVAEFGKLHPIFPVKKLPAKVLKQMESKDRYNLVDYLACMFWAGWENAEKHIHSITFRVRPAQSDLLYRFDAEISGDEGWDNTFLPVQKHQRPESVVRHNQAEDTLVVDEVTLRSQFLRGLFDAARQAG